MHSDEIVISDAMLRTVNLEMTLLAFTFHCSPSSFFRLTINSMLLSGIPITIKFQENRPSDFNAKAFENVSFNDPSPPLNPSL